jgi:hypothetical protein
MRRENPSMPVGTTMSGTNVAGLSGLRALLLERPEQFPRTVTEKLLAYALGRMVQHYDRPAIRSIVRDAAAENYSWSSLIRGIVKSPAFQMRRTVPDVRNAADFSARSGRAGLSPAKEIACF